MASTYSWSSGTAAGKAAEAVRSVCRGGTCWGYGSKLGVLRRRVGRRCGTENWDRKQNFIRLIIAEQLDIYVSSSRLLSRAVALLGLVETCTCTLN